MCLKMFPRCIVYTAANANVMVNDMESVCLKGAIVTYLKFQRWLGGNDKNQKAE